MAAAPASVGVDLPADPSDGITVRSATGVSVGIGLPNADDATVANVEDAGVVSYDNGDGSTTVPVAKDNGSVQIATVIEGPQAPTRYEYPLDLPAGASIVLDPATGAGGVFDAHGAWITGIAPPWAKDADGRSVPTSFEVDGTTLVQIVEHSAAFSYPVVADPYLGAEWWGQIQQAAAQGRCAQTSTSPTSRVRACGM